MMDILIMLIGCVILIIAIVNLFVKHDKLSTMMIVVLFCTMCIMNGFKEIKKELEKQNERLSIHNRLHEEER